MINKYEAAAIGPHNSIQKKYDLLFQDRFFFFFKNDFFIEIFYKKPWLLSYVGNVSNGKKYENSYKAQKH